MTVIFLHIPKTGGASLANMLAGHFAPGGVYNPQVREIGDRPPGDVNGYDFIFGHLDWSELAAIASPVQIISMLREPVSRALSVYWYWRAHSWAYGVEQLGSRGVECAKTLSPEDFFHIAPPDVLGNIENTAARQLVGAEYWTLNTGFTIPDAEVIRICRRHIDEMAFCGVTEHFEATAAAVMRTLGLPPTPSRRDNVFANLTKDPNFEAVVPTPPSPALMARIRAMTAIDAALHRYAARRWPTRWAVLSQALSGLSGAAGRLGNPRP